MPSRRQLLRLVALGLTGLCAGCLSESTESELDTPTPPSEPYTDSFYLENLTEVEHCISVSVVRTSDGKSVFGGTYHLSPNRGAQFPDVGTRGVDHEVTARLDTGEELTDTWMLGGCPPRDDGDDALAGGVQIRDDGMVFTRNGCDGLAFGFEAGLYTTSPAESDCKLD